MKAQFATIEAIIGLLLVVAALAFARVAINSHNGNAYVSRQAAASDFAAYDLINQLSQNASAMSCIDNYSVGDAPCLEYYKPIYGLSSFDIFIVGNGTPSYTGSARCFPYESGEGYEELCVEAD